MRRELTLPVTIVGVAGLVLIAIGAVYLTVECQALPGFMGSVKGDTSPRTGLGVISLALGLSALGALLVAMRRR